MTDYLLPLLRCPDCCESHIEPHEGKWDGSRLEDGTVRCAGCGRLFAVTEGIVRMLPSDLQRNESDSVDSDSGTGNAAVLIRKRSEMSARDAQVDDYDRMWHLNLFGLIEIPAMLRGLRLAPSDLLLEGGCGTGRMTRSFAARCSHLVSIDFSWESLRVCRRKLDEAGVENVNLIQADLCRLPLVSGAFDKAVSGQVLEHIPSQEARAAAVGSLSRVLKENGNLVISAYQYSVLMRLFGQKEGEHAGGIYFFRFTRNELRSLLSSQLRVNGITGALIYHYIARCTKG